MCLHNALFYLKDFRWRVFAKKTGFWRKIHGF